MKCYLSLFSALFILSSISLVGCGGGAGSSGSSASAVSRGEVQVRLQWPERRSRQVPAGSNSVRIVVRTADGQELINRLMVRPSVDTTTSTESLANLPQAVLSVDATAYPNGDGTGTAQGHMSTFTNVFAGKATELNLTMDSTIARVAILPDNIPFSGVPIAITAAAYDAADNLILTDRWTWTDSNPAAIALQPNGSVATVSAVGPGTSVITLTETESGKSIQRTFNVAPLH